MNETKKTGPYIGVTGFMYPLEVLACENSFREAVRKCGTRAAAEMKFMVGILVSSKTLAGGTNKWFNRYPPVSQVSDLMQYREDHLLHTIHYNTDEPATIDKQIDQLMALSPHIDAIQLNIKWVSHVKLQRVRRKYPHLRIILQIGAGALAEVDEPGDILLGEALRAYEGVADDFLVDPSGGTGKELDVWRAFACIADDEIPKGMQPGVAGGRNADNVHEVKGLMRRLRRPVNIDAEGRLRTLDEGGGGWLIVPEAQRFIKSGVPLIGAF